MLTAGRWQLLVRPPRFLSCKGRPRAGDYIELAWLDEHYTYQLYGSDTLETAAQALADSDECFSQTMTATRAGRRSPCAMQRRRVRMRTGSVYMAMCGRQDGELGAGLADF